MYINKFKDPINSSNIIWWDRLKMHNYLLKKYSPHTILKDKLQKKHEKESALFSVTRGIDTHNYIN